MKRISFIAVFLLIFSLIGAIQTEGIPLNGYPWQLAIAEKDGMKRVVAIDRTESQVMIIDTATMKVSTIPLPEYPTDILVKNSEAYVTCVEAGKVTLLDPFSATVVREVTVGRHVFKFLKFGSEESLWVLDMEGAVLELDKDLNVVKIYNLPHFSLDTVLWNDYLVSLYSENYETIWGTFLEDGEEGVQVQNLTTGQTTKFYGGKIPTWIHAAANLLYVLSYWDGHLTAISRELQVVGELELKSKVNSPIWSDARCYLLSFDNSTLVAVDLESLRVVKEAKLQGKGPLRMRLIGRYFYILNVLDNSVDVVDAESLTVVGHFEVGRYPVDVIQVDEKRIAVACEESKEILLLSP